MKTKMKILRHTKRTVSLLLVLMMAAGLFGSFTAPASAETNPFVPVSDITGVPDAAVTGVPLDLSPAAVLPENAANTAVVWAVKDAGTTGANIIDNALHTTGAGTATLTATVAGGAESGDFTKDFEIAVTDAPPFVPVSDITGVPDAAVTGVPLDLSPAAVLPENAANTAVVWAVKDTGTTGANIIDNALHTTGAGTATLTATVAGGAEGGDFTKDFEIAVTDAPPALLPPKAVTQFDELSFEIRYQDVSSGAKKESLNLPMSLFATVDGAASAEIPGITWESAAYSDETGMTVHPDPSTGGDSYEYVWTAVLPEGYLLLENPESPAALPVIYALVDGSGLVSATDAAWNSSAAPAISAGETATVTIASGASGTLTVPSGATVTLEGSVWDATAGVTLNIAPDAAVLWKAVFIGVGSPLVRVTGGGKFQVEPEGWIYNTGSGDALDAEAKIFVTGTAEDSGVVQATTGTAIQGIGPAATVTLSGTAAVINESATNIRPIINMTDAANTADNVFIHDEAMVWTIDASNHEYAYAVQTYGNVIMTGGDVYSGGNYGRAINLVGLRSKAMISGGTVHADGANGVAISTATSRINNLPAADAVAETVISVSGSAVVSSLYNWAIHSTGHSTKITVSGDATVTTGSDGDAIYAQGNAPDVSVTGGVVAAENGYAINTSRGGTVSVTGGFVFSYGDGVIKKAVNKANFVPGGSGIMTEWNPRTKIYIEGSSNNLTVHPGGQTVTWHNLSGQGGVQYAGNRFFPLPVMVNDPNEYGLLFVKAKQSFYLDTNRNMLYDPDSDPIYETGKGSSWGIDANGDLWLNGFQWITTAPAALTIIGDTLIDVRGDSTFISYFTENERLAGNVSGSYYGIYSASYNLAVKSSTGIHVLTGSAVTEEIVSLAGVPVTLSGIKCGGLITVETGAGLTGTGLSLSDGDISYGIDCPDLRLLGMTVNPNAIQAAGYTGALRYSLDLPNAYAYSEGSLEQPLDPYGQSYFHNGSIEHGIPYTFDATDQQVYIYTTSGAYATIDGTVTGVVGTPLTPQTVTIEIYGTQIDAGVWDNSADPEDIYEWFNNWPMGVTADATYVNDPVNDRATITLAFTGTPRETMDRTFGRMLLYRLVAPDPVFVQENPNAGFLIAAADTLCTVGYDANGGNGGFMPSGTVISGEDYTVAECGFTREGYRFAGWATSAGGAAVYDAGDVIENVTADMKLFAVWEMEETEEPGSEIEIPITNDSDRDALVVTVGLMIGDSAVVDYVTLTVAKGVTVNFTFCGITDGWYNVVAYDNTRDYIITQDLRVTGGEIDRITAKPIVFLNDMRRSEVQIEKGLPAVSVGNLPDLFLESAIYKPADNSAGIMQINLEVTAPAAGSAENLTAHARTNGQLQALCLDLSLSHIHYDRFYNTIKVYPPITDTLPALLEIVVPFTGGTVVAVYREHGGEIQPIPKGTPNAAGEYFTQEGGYVILHAGRFSSYSFAVAAPASGDPTPTPAATGSGAATIPYTGDGSLTALWAALFGSSALGSAFLLTKRSTGQKSRRRQGKKDSAGF